MNILNGNGHGQHSEIAGTRPVVLVRYRPGLTGETVRTVHLVPLPAGDEVGAVSALCGILLRPEEIESVTPGEGMPCTMCIVSHVGGSDPPPPDTAPVPGAGINDDAGPLAAGVTYRDWGWPVTLRGEQIRLCLGHDIVALLIPASLAAEVTDILTRRRCSPAMLAHPYAAEHRILLAGERFGVTLPLPPGVHQVSGTLPLPPTITPRGPVTWVHPPLQNSLRLCREIDLFGAIRAVTAKERTDERR